MSIDASSAAQRASRHASWTTLLVICLGFFMINLDGTIVYIATPSLMKGLGLALDQVLWVYNGYLLAYAVLLITAARLGDLLGPRRLFVVGLWVFTAASAACGLATDAPQLIAARIVQGLGAALLAPQPLTLLTAIFPAERRGAALGFWAGVVGIALVAGPTLGGLIVTALDWRWIFFLNVPVGVGAALAATRVVPLVRTGVAHRLDVPGIALSTAALFPLVFALVEGQSFAWAPWIWALLAGGGALLIVFAAWEARQAEPLIPLGLFAHLDFSLMAWVGLAFQFAVQAIFIPLSMYAQSVLGMSAFSTGIAFAPLSIASTFVAPAAGRLADRIGGKQLVVGGLALFAAGIGWLALAAQPDSTGSTLTLPLTVAGIGMGLLLAPMTSVAVRGLRSHDVAAASGVLSTTRQIGSLMGAAVVGAVLQQQLSIEAAVRAATAAEQLPASLRPRFIDELIHSVSSGGVGVAAPGLDPAVAQQIDALARDVFDNAFVAAMRPSIAVAVGALLLAALTTLVLQRRTAASASPSVMSPERARGTALGTSIRCRLARHLGPLAADCRLDVPSA